MPAFVVLEHDHPTLHWDLMLEAGETLRTWRLSARPSAGLTTNCESLPDHRRAYLEYEGPVSGGRGSVKRVMSGRFHILDDSPQRLRAIINGEGVELEIELSPPTGSGRAVINRAAK